MKYFYFILIILLAACTPSAGTIKVLEVNSLFDENLELTLIVVQATLDGFSENVALTDISFALEGTQILPATSASSCGANTCFLRFVPTPGLKDFDVDTSYLLYKDVRYKLR